MPVILDQILSTTRSGLPELRRRQSALEREALAAPVPPSFAAALRRRTVAVIAEVKRRSPSAGDIRPDLDPVERAALYAHAGAAAVSVLTDGPYFGGSIADLRAVAGVVPVPILRKDFIVDEVQILEARAAGAAAILLIARVLDRVRLEALLQHATALGLDALVEIHTAAELDDALAAGARVIGVNSRDLDDFHVDTAAAWRLVAQVPRSAMAVAESGMATVADVAAAAAGGADAVLIGTALSAAAEPAKLLAELAEVSRRDR